MAVDLELAYRPAAETAALIARRELSPVDVVANSLARIAQVNPSVNCFCDVYADDALASARAAEAAVLRGDRLGPLHGVPVAIKDLTPVAGKRTTLGSKAFADNFPDADAVIVEDLRRAGAIIIGKTTTPEFAHASFTHSALFGITRNPWDLSRSPGGSSGGSGVAVATGCVPLAEGTDMGGSVRIPAAYCGIVGLKPSFGRIPMTILPGLFDLISHFGPLARTIDDAALFLDATQGPDERDILSLTERAALPVPTPRDVRGKRLALSVDLGFYAIDGEIEAAVRAAARALAEAGAEVEEVDLKLGRRHVDAWVEMWGVFMAAYFGDLLPAWRDQMDPEIVALIEAGNRASAVTYKRTELVRSELWHALAGVFREHDALLCPTMALPPPTVETRDSAFGQEDEKGRYHGLDMTAIFNLVAPCPALSVPAGFTRAGMPIGLQILGRRHQDAEVLQIGAAFEALRPWTQARPPI